ncbi:hypothetical protein [Petrotoga sibirica]|uniref:Lipoprotein n=1 Tax=Petrotoga sibirica TaxID=156202 RepID=A0A4R8EUR5_9BACT|nr:hypothetical protein [Petrotoga sibirica]TDX14455.1 hypothetical protein C8D74_1101 [Petrotoga sibirica]
MKKLSVFFMILAIGLLFVSCANLPIGGDGTGNDITNDVIINTFIGAMANRILYHPANLIMYHIERRSSFLSLFI